MTSTKILEGIKKRWNKNIKIHRVVRQFSFKESIMEAACRNELKYVELRERCGLYSAYYLPDEEIVNRIAAQCKRDFRD